MYFTRIFEVICFFGGFMTNLNPSEPKFRKTFMHLFS